MINLLNRLRRWAGVDRPVFYTALGRVWSLISGPVTILLITRFFTPEVQGYYYAFGSVLALQVFFELGFGQSVGQFVSHEFAHLRFQATGVLEGDPRARARFISLGRLLFKWYGVTAILIIVGLGTAGHCFFWMKHDASVSWVWPWWSLALTTGLSLALLPVWAMLEGSNQLGFTCGLRVWAAVVSSLAMWLALWVGAGLFAGAIVVLCGILMTTTVSGWRWRGLWGELRHEPKGQSVSWRHEIWPFQWRVAVSSISGYFTIQLMTLVLFYFHGPVIAGKMGVTLQLLLSLYSLASGWIGTKGPRLAILVAQRKFGELDRLFFKATAQAVGVYVAGSVMFLLALMFVQNRYPIGQRLLGLAPTVLLLAGAVVTLIVLGQTMYLRAHKQEPFMWLSVANGLATALLVLVLGRFYGAWGVALGYTLVQMGMLAWATTVWRRCRRNWHPADAPTEPAI